MVASVIFFNIKLMPNYYLDIETNGLDEVQNKILTIQWAELDRYTGKLIMDREIVDL